MLTSGRVALGLYHEVFEGKNSGPRKNILNSVISEGGESRICVQGCRTKPSLALGRMSISEERPKSMVAFES